MPRIEEVLRCRGRRGHFGVCIDLEVGTASKCEGHFSKLIGVDVDFDQATLPRIRCRVVQKQIEYFVI